MKPVTLSARRKKLVLSAFTPKTRHYRVIEYLSDTARVSAAELSQKCSTPNISDIAQKYNPTLRDFGLAIGCHPAPMYYINQFHQPSAMQEWSLCKLSQDELRLPTKGPTRPKVFDPLFKERKEIILGKIKEGEFLNSVLAQTRDAGTVRDSR